VDGFVPSGTLQIKTIAEDTILRHLSHILWLDFIVDFVLVLKLIDSDNVFSGIVLHGTCEERLWEEETRDPISWWLTLINPFHNEIDSVVQVSDPGRERGQGKGANFCKGSWDLIVEKVGPLSLKPLSSWITDLNDRIDFIMKWVDKGKPPAYWISGFFFP
jgi:hypothetical protein